MVGYATFAALFYFIGVPAYHDWQLDQENKARYLEMERDTIRQTIETITSNQAIQAQQTRGLVRRLDAAESTGENK